MSSNSKYLVTTFYKFTPLAKADLAGLRESLLNKGKELDVRGLLLIGEEGTNATLCALEKDLDEFKKFLLDSLPLADMIFKDSWAEKNPFHRWKVKIRKEIVTIGSPGLVPPAKKDHHISPAQWHRALQEEDTVCIDTRNAYETDIGKFKNAIDPRIDNFQEFSGFMKKSEIAKDKKVLIYCTGGIRCEKAILDLNEQGYNNVYQLDGGILNYIKEYPNEEFQGECFVFDHRVGLDQNLAPSKRYSLCPHCGDPGDVTIDCIQCDRKQIVCQSCLDKQAQEPAVKTCSKNCAHHLKLGHNSRKRHIESKNKDLPAFDEVAER